MSFIHWCVQNAELISTIAALSVALLRVTKWGKANAEALDAVVKVVEAVDAKDVKVQVAKAVLSANAQDALNDKVATHDEKKETPSTASILVRETAKAFGVKIDR